MRVIYYRVVYIILARIHLIGAETEVVKQQGGGREGSDFSVIVCWGYFDHLHTNEIEVTKPAGDVLRPLS